MSIKSDINEEVSVTEIFFYFTKILSFLKSHIKLIIFSGFFSGIMGFFYAWFQPVNYVAKMTFVVEEAKGNSGGFGGLASLAGQFGVDVGGSSSGNVFSGDNIIQYFKSSSLAKNVLLSETYRGSSKSIADEYVSYHFKKKSNVVFPPTSKGIKFSRYQDSLLDEIITSINLGRLTIAKVDKKSSFFEITCKMQNEALAKQYCERLLNEAVNRFILIKTERQKKVVESLQGRADSIANLLTSKTVSSANLQASASTMDVNPLYKASNLIQNESVTRDKALLSTIFASVSQNLEVAKFTLSQETPVVQIIDNQNFPLKKEKLSRLKYAVSSSVLTIFLLLIFLTIKKLKKLHYFKNEKF